MRLLHVRRIRGIAVFLTLFLVSGVLVVYFAGDKLSTESITTSPFVESNVKSYIETQVQYYRDFFRGDFDQDTKQFNPLEIKQIPEQVIDALYERKLERVNQKLDPEIDWTKYAYVNYISNPVYLCNTLILFDALINEYKSKATFLLLISDHIATAKDGAIKTAETLKRIKALSETQVVVKVVDNIHIDNDLSEWSDSLTKLRIFDQTEYDRIIYLDNDGSIMDNLDELFFLPDYIQFAAPTTYWYLGEGDIHQSVKYTEKSGNPLDLNYYLNKIMPRINQDKDIYNLLPNLPHNIYVYSENIYNELVRTNTLYSRSKRLYQREGPGKIQWTSDLMVIKPSHKLFTTFMNEMVPNISSDDVLYDMDVINEYFYNMKQVIYEHFTTFNSVRKDYTPEILTLPGIRYSLLTQSINHAGQHVLLRNSILGYVDLDENGRPKQEEIEPIVKRAKFIHYSDYPIMKPWFYNEQSKMSCDTHGIPNEDKEKVCELFRFGYAPFYKRKEICR